MAAPTPPTLIRRMMTPKTDTQRRYAIVKDGKVINVIVAEPEIEVHVATHHPDWTLVPIPRPVECGDLWDGQRFTPPDTDETTSS